MKIKKTLTIIIVTTGLSISGYSHADWTGEAELGISSSGGNTDNTVFNTIIDFELTQESWRHNIFGHFYYAKSSGKRTAENCDIGYKPRYFMTDQDYLFSFLRYDQDKFSSIDHRTTGVAGYGRQLVSTEKHLVDVELGLGARQTVYLSSPSTANLDGNELVYYLGGKYIGRISNTARFFETVRVEAAQDNSYIESITGLGLSITGALSAKISFTARYNTDVTGDKGKKTDTLTGVNLVYSF